MANVQLPKAYQINKEKKGSSNHSVSNTHKQPKVNKPNQNRSNDLVVKKNKKVASNLKIQQETTKQSFNDLDNQFQTICASVLYHCVSEYKVYSNSQSKTVSIFGKFFGRKKKNSMDENNQFVIHLHLNSDYVKKNLKILNTIQDIMRKQYNVQFTEGRVSLIHIFEWLNFWDMV